MRKVLPLVLGLCLLGSASAQDLPLKVLYLGLSKGFAHSSVGPGGVAITALGEQTGLWTTKVSADIADLAPDAIGQWDVIFFYTTGDLGLNDAAKQGLLDWVNQGGGLGGIHSATDTYYDWPEYGELMGGYFAGHPWNQVARFNVEDPDHPVVAHLAPSFNFLEEIYIFRNYDREAQHNLISVDNTSVDASQGANVRPDLYYALLWTKDVGQGRVLYNGFGHHDGAFADQRMLDMLTGTVKWLTKLDWQSDPSLIALQQAGDVAGLVARASTGLEVLQTEAVESLGQIDSAAAWNALGDFAAADQPVALRLAALAAMGRSEQGSVTALQPYLDDEDAAVRRAGLRAVARRGGDAAAGVLLDALSSPHADLRALATELLALNDSPAVTDRLLQLLDSGDAEVMAVAISGLLNREDPRIAPALVTAARGLTEANQSVLPALLARLARLANDPAAGALLREHAASANPAVRAAALRAIGGEQIDGLVELVAPALFAENGQVASAAADVVRGRADLDWSAYLSPYITKWQVLGPVAQDFTVANEAATLTKTDATVAGVDGNVSWKPAEARGDGLLDLLATIERRENVAGYAWAVVEAPAAMDAQLRLGSDDGCVVWLNGEKVHEATGNRGLNRDSDRVPVRLRAGRNDLLVKVIQGGGDWSLAVRFGSPAGALAGMSLADPR